MQTGKAPTSPKKQLESLTPSDLIKAIQQKGCSCWSLLEQWGLLPVCTAAREEPQTSKEGLSSPGG